MFKKAFRQGRSERRGESYSLPYAEPLSDARTPLEDFFNILLVSGLLRGASSRSEESLWGNCTKSIFPDLP
jgi:hypothetical protein